MTERPPVSGLPAERTALAWLRASLATLAATVAMDRLAAQLSTPAVTVLTGVCLPVAAGVSVLSWLRYRHVSGGGDIRALLGDGVLPACATVLSTLLGVAGLSYVLYP